MRDRKEGITTYRLVGLGVGSGDDGGVGFTPRGGRRHHGSRRGHILRQL